ncbi:asparagine synthase (glutamine-hydrolyzing) [Azospirillum himalayense]|uniref:asparagine synthase (glutamine-hydrolyzing) n=1 Tax=Azospirillum himalayense TaxID=654847 RepID=A0ABW0G1Q4_9PROT
MCGIAGMVHLDGAPASGDLVRRMTDAIAHRGPDGEGVYVDGQAGLGHRRLAIIDLSAAGRQPMVTPDGRYALTFNGEIYNFQELRAELQSLGYRFVSRTDTEVILHAWAEWGPKALDRFNGMFAFAIWDSTRRRLTLARDRFGIKPLYYATVGRTLLFASEVKALLTFPGMAAAMDREGLIEYLTFQNFFTNRTLFAGVRLLPAASCLNACCETGSCHTFQYWDFNFHEPQERLAPDAYADTLDQLIVQAVNRQLVSDVDVGSYLSGGMDSGSITALASRRIKDLRTFTVGFDLHSASGIECSYDERESAEALSSLCRTEHYEMVLKAGDMERCMPSLVYHMEEPRVGQSYPNYYAAKLAGRFGKVVLSGTGGDELFGGYPWRYYRAVVNSSFEDYIDKYYLFWQRLIPNSLIHRMFQPIWPDVKHVWTRDIFRNVFTSHASRMTRSEDYINHSLYFEAKTFLHGLLVIEDKLSMAHGLETRVPMLDNDLVDFAQTIPVGMKLGNLAEVVRLNENDPGPKSKVFFERTRDGKLLLRNVMQRYIPVEVTDRAKQGFSGPDASWFRGESIDYVRRMLLEGECHIHEFLDRATVRDLVEEHLNGTTNRRLLIWALLYLEQWCHTFLAGGGPTPAKP